VNARLAETMAREAVTGSSDLTLMEEHLKPLRRGSPARGGAESGTR
jgi:hypothetical protein